MLAHAPRRGVFDRGGGGEGGEGLLDVLDEHPEGAARVRNMAAALRRGPIAAHVEWRAGRGAALSELAAFHAQEYIDELVAADAAGGKHFCDGTEMLPGSWAATLLAAGTTLEAADFVLRGKGSLAYALVRPPGHHAQPKQADGYCFINNAGLSRVAVLDIDVHYGNGTAEGFFSRDDVYTISMHMNHGSWDPVSHPQSLLADQVGVGRGVGYNMNIPLPNGTGDRGYDLAFKELICPAMDEYQPHFIVFVIGQDSSMFDPNGRMCLTMGGYRNLGRLVRTIATKYSNDRLLVVQEGGYQPTYSAYCLHATLEGVLCLDYQLDLDDPLAGYPETDEALETVKVAIKNVMRERTVAIAGARTGMPKAR
eukprot:SM000035S13081  [mRNA]  locus=s35:335864:338033:+ [translate_table: standard]